MTEVSKSEADRRDFLKTAGMFAVTVPPTMTFLLSTTMSSNAIAKSGRGDEGCGNGAESDNTDTNNETPPGCEGRPDGT